MEDQDQAACADPEHVCSDDALKRKRTDSSEEAPPARRPHTAEGAPGGLPAVDAEGLHDASAACGRPAPAADEGAGSCAPPGSAALEAEAILLMEAVLAAMAATPLLTTPPLGTPPFPQDVTIKAAEAFPSQEARSNGDLHEKRLEAEVHETKDPQQVEAALPGPTLVTMHDDNPEPQPHSGEILLSERTDSHCLT
jgi:hypothetical protein